MQMTIINLKDVSKTYQLGEIEVPALKDINLSIKKGEFSSIVGHSGSGKSTLMHIMGLLDRPTNGKVLFLGKNVAALENEELAEYRNRHIGFVFQTFNLLPRTTALENVALPLIYTGVERNARLQKAKEKLENVGLGERLEHTPAQLSGGQQQRVAIARALVNNPDIIFADEPTGNLDSKSGAEVMKLLADLNNKGNTIILVTHELEIANSTKRTIELKDGKIVKDKTNYHRLKPMVF